RYSPERLGNELLRRMERLGWLTSTMPDQLQEVLDDLRTGRLTIRSHNLEQRRALDHLGRRVFSALVISTLLLATVFLLVYGPDWAAIPAAAVTGLSLIAHFIGEAYDRFVGR